MSFSRRVLHMDPLPLARFEASSPTRRDPRFARHVLRHEDHSMIISTLYLPETAVNVLHQHVPSRSVCAIQKECSVIIGTVR
jgi:hypothetical protein